jgi:predicted transcriptional regulator
VKTVSVKLPPALAAWLTQQARELRRTKSDLVRQALERQRSTSSQGTCMELMQDICGSVQGPTDLSTNPKHLAGFGE